MQIKVKALGHRKKNCWAGCFGGHPSSVIYFYYDLKVAELVGI